jgi:hypothetical protein
MKRFAGKTPDQIGIVVADIDVAVAHHSRLYEVSPNDWIRQENSPETGMRGLYYRGQPGKFVERVALFGSDPQIELMQPVEGPSVHWDWLQRGRTGLHHIQFEVDDLQGAITELEAEGYPSVQGGYGFLPDNAGGFAYFDTEPDLGYFLELVQLS